jgi:hypothetical protein
MADFGRTLALAAAMLVGGCGGGGGSSSSSGGPSGLPAGDDQAALAYLAQLKAAPYEIGIVRELGEYQVARFRNKTTGDAFGVFGSKNVSGQVVDIQQIVRTDASGKRTTADYLPGGGRSFANANGVQLDVKRQANGKWLAEFSDPRSGESFRTTLPDLAGGTAGSPAPAPAAQVVGTPSTANQIVARILTSNCGSTSDPVGQRVYVQFNDGLNGVLGSYPAQRTGPGAYVAAIPNPSLQAPVSIEFLKSSISALNEAFGTACTVDKAHPMAAAATCPYVGEQMALTGLGSPVAAEFLALCESAVVVLKSTCAMKEAINLPAPPTIENSGAEVIKQTESFLIDKIPDHVLAPTLQAYAAALPTDNYGPAVELTTGVNEVSLRLDLFQLSVGDIDLTPAAPGARESYTASASLQCLVPGARAVLKVVGSDGYTSQQQETYASVTNAATIRLVIPGADEAGIRDTLTVTVTPPNAPAVTRTAFLVFH